ncbi:site-specific DNA-methyltransferase [Microscilla marina]|nr:site-specific DNA-methyltransferase [Microscilla marina]
MGISKMPLEAHGLGNQPLIEGLKQLAPEVIKDGKIDFELLRELFGDQTLDDEEKAEPWGLNWTGKSQARKLAMARTKGTLRPLVGEGVNEASSQNLFIQGDNLEVLKTLQKSYLGKIKMIYIDPPYNTGNDFVYEDDFRDNLSHYIDKAGKNLHSNKKDSGRFHATWLNFMYPRLKIAKSLLKDDGAIFVSIDDHEVHNLRALMNEIFGEENFMGILLWKRRQNADNRNQSNVSSDHEYLLLYSKSENTKFLGKSIDLSKYKNPDNDPRGPWASIDLSGLATKDQRPNLHYDIVDPKTNLSYPPNPNRGWSKSKENVLKMIEEGRILFPKKVTGRPREKKFLSNLNQTVTGFSTWLESDNVGFTTNGTRDIAEVMGGKIFNFPKPVKLIQTLIKQATTSQDIILDFFAGSATTAQAVTELNKEDGGNRKFILVQLEEETPPKSEARKAGYEHIAQISKDRIRKVIEKIQTEQNSLEAEVMQLEDDLQMLKNEKDQLVAEQNIDLTLFDNDANATKPKALQKLEDKLAQQSTAIEDCRQKIAHIAQTDLGFKAFQLAQSNFKEWQAPQGTPDAQQLGLAFEEAADTRLEASFSKENIIAEILLQKGFTLDLPTMHAAQFDKNTVWQVTDPASGKGVLVCLDEQMHPNTAQQLRQVVEHTFICRGEAISDQIKLQFSDAGLIETI